MPILGNAHRCGSPVGGPQQQVSQQGKKRTKIDTNITQFTPEQLDALTTAIRGLVSAGGFLPNIEPPIRRRLKRVGAKTEPFATRSLAVGKQVPVLLSGKTAGGRGDEIIAQRDALRSASAVLSQLLRGVDDAIILLSKEFHSAAFSIYENVKRFGPALGLDEQLKELTALRKQARKKDSPPVSGTPAPAGAPELAKT